MRNITYKYNIGDIVKFKDKYHFTASCNLEDLAGTVAKITDRRYYGSACYALEGHGGVFVEECFAGLASEASKNSPCREEAVGADTSKPSESSCDTGDSGESKTEPTHDEAKWSWVTEDDLYCSSCGYAALNDYRGNPAASKFCPHCGRYMTNHQQPED